MNEDDLRFWDAAMIAAMAAGIRLDDGTPKNAARFAVEYADELLAKRRERLEAVPKDKP